LYKMGVGIKILRALTVQVLTKSGKSTNLQHHLSSQWGPGPCLQHKKLLRGATAAAAFCDPYNTSRTPANSHTNTYTLLIHTGEVVPHPSDKR